jgi:HAD superfamily hydrolase (TIGR01509 family)
MYNAAAYMVKAIIFDLDGVIVLSDPGQFAVLQEVFRKKGLSLPRRTFPQLIGRTTHTFLESLEPLLKRELVEEMYGEYKKEFSGHLLRYITPLSPTVKFIARYQGASKLGLASMSPMETIIAETKHFKIYKKFHVIVSRDEITKHKPDPEIYLRTAEKLGVKPADCAVVEDSVVGVQAARRAGMPCYVFLNGINRKSAFSRFKIAGFIKTLHDYRRLF